MVKLSQAYLYRITRTFAAVAAAVFFTNESFALVSKLPSPAASSEFVKWLEEDPDLLHEFSEPVATKSPLEIPFYLPPSQRKTDAEFYTDLKRATRKRKRIVGAKAFAGQTAARQVFSAAEQLRLIKDGSSKCTSWVGQFGFGPHAKALFEELQQQPKLRSRVVRGLEKKSVFYDGPKDSSFQQACPKFRSLDDEHKEAVWVAVFMWASFRESSCSATAANPNAPNGTAAGLFQLHHGEEQKYQTYRPGACRAGDSNNPDTSIRCAVGMIEHQLASSNGKLFDPKSHFGVFRPQGDVVTFSDGRPQRVVISKYLLLFLNQLPMCQNGMPVRNQGAN